MLLLTLLLSPVLGLLTISVYGLKSETDSKKNHLIQIKFIGLLTLIFNLFISLIIFIKFDFSCNQYQFVQAYQNIGYYDFYLGIDGLSIYFILLTCIVMPISLLSNWVSVSNNVKSYVILLLLLETLLLLVFLALDVLLYYVFFESILFPLFILIGLYGSSNKVRASFYLFLYTLIGSLFLLLSIIGMYNITGVTDFDSLFKINLDYFFQFFIFYGIFISFAVKTPTIFLNNWLLKAHVESPLGGSLILASVVLKLSLYGIVRLILPILPKAYIDNSYIIYVIGVITIVYASVATLRTIDIKELIAYSSVSHAAVYFLGVFSNNVQGIQGAIIFGLAHGFVSSGLFISTGGILYDRSGNRLITIYRGLAQIMPIFSILFFILCLANAGAPLTFNFLGEFMCLYGAFERLPFLGIFASTSVVLSAAYSLYMFNRIIFGGSLSKLFMVNISDLNKREFFMVTMLVYFTIMFGIYPAAVTDGINYYITNLIYNSDDIMYGFFFLAIIKSPKYRYIFKYAILATLTSIFIRYSITYFPSYVIIPFFDFFGIELENTTIYKFTLGIIVSLYTTIYLLINFDHFHSPMGPTGHNLTSGKPYKEFSHTHTMNSNNPSGSGSGRGRGSGNNNQLVTRRGNNNQFLPRRGNNNQLVPRSGNNNQLVPRSSNQQAPVPRSSNQQWPFPRSSNNFPPLPRIYNNNQFASSSSNNNQLVPSSSNQQAPVPSSSNNNQLVPSSYNNNQVVPGSYNNNQLVPNQQVPLPQVYSLLNPEPIGPLPQYPGYPRIPFPPFQGDDLYDPFYEENLVIPKIAQNRNGTIYSPENPTHLPLPNRERRSVLKRFLTEFIDAHNNDTRVLRGFDTMVPLLEKINTVYGTRYGYAISTEIKKIILDDPELCRKLKGSNTHGIQWSKIKVGMTHTNFRQIMEALDR